MSTILSGLYYDAVFFMTALETKVDFYNTNASEGDGGSVWPFIGFMMSLFGLLFLVIGIVNYISAKRKFNVFFDQRNVTDEPTEEGYKKDMTRGIIVAVIGGVLTVASFIIL